MNKYLLLFFFGVHNVFLPLCTVYFTPRDDIKVKLIELIEHERKSIDCAMYMFTEKSIAQAILAAHLRGVRVRLILDPISMDVKYGKGLFLKNNGIYICVYNALLRGFFEPIMHHKFIIFGFNQLYQKSLVWTGSYNCTSSASRLHEENVILLDDISAINEYQQCFKMMLSRFDLTNRFLLEEFKSVEE